MTDYRAVDQHTGFVVPTSMAAAVVLLDAVTADRDVLVEKVQALSAERDNLIASIPDTAALASFLKDAITDRDFHEDKHAELLEENARLQDRLEELEGEVRVLTDAIDEASA